MVSLREATAERYDNIVDGIAWVVFYKNKRSWESSVFWETDNFGDGTDFSEEDVAEMKRILETDSFAICINGYQMGFGDALSKRQTADKLLWMYEEHLNTLKNVVENLSY